MQWAAMRFVGQGMLVGSHRMLDEKKTEPAERENGDLRVTLQSS